MTECRVNIGSTSGDVKQGMGIHRLCSRSSISSFEAAVLASAQNTSVSESRQHSMAAQWMALQAQVHCLGMMPQAGANTDDAVVSMARSNNIEDHNVNHPVESMDQLLKLMCESLRSSQQICLLRMQQLGQQTAASNACTSRTHLLSRVSSNNHHAGQEGNGEVDAALDSNISGWIRDDQTSTHAVTASSGAAAAPDTNSVCVSSSNTAPECRDVFADEAGDIAGQGHTRTSTAMSDTIRNIVGEHQPTPYPSQLFHSDETDYDMPMLCESDQQRMNDDTASSKALCEFSDAVCNNVESRLPIASSVVAEPLTSPELIIELQQECEITPSIEQTMIAFELDSSSAMLRRPSFCISDVLIDFNTE